MHRLLDGKVALITGAGRGIGRAAAELFTAHGGGVALTDIDEEPLAETAAAVRAAGGRALTLAGDVTDPRYPASGDSSTCRPTRWPSDGSTRG